MIRCAVYLRVSTRDQRLVQQWRELRASVESRGWTIVAVYRERRSAAAGADRPQWRRLLRDAGRRRFGAVAAASLDRIGRSAIDILRAVESFKSRGVKLYLAREGIASEDAIGSMLLTVLAGVAELERDMISERTRQGLRSARARGESLGRPTRAISERDLQRFRRGETTKAALARELGVSMNTLKRRLRGPKTPPPAKPKIAAKTARASAR